MNKATYNITRKLVTLVLVTASVAAFATMDYGGGKRLVAHKQSLLTYTPTYNYKSFSLKSSYNYRGKTIFNQAVSAGRYLQTNNVVTYELGNATYILPMKKKLLLEKIRFNPAPVIR